MPEAASQTEYDCSAAEGKKEPGDEDEALPATQPVPGSGISDEDLRLVLETGGPVSSNKSKATTDKNQKLHRLLGSSTAVPQASISPTPVLVTVPKTPGSGFQKYNKPEIPSPCPTPYTLATAVASNPT